MSLPAEKPAAQPARPPAPPRRAGGLNIARRPFVNTRPVTRVSLLLWLFGLLLLLGNVSLFWNYLSGSAEKRAELERLQADIQRQQQTIGQLQQRLAGLDLEQQNRQVKYLNRKIAERTFSWSLLFDRLAEVLPDDVRLTRLAPKPLGRRDDTGRREDELEPLDDRVQLIIGGVSRSDDGHLDFVERLFAHESFDDPDFSRETREAEGNTLEFDLQVTYIPGDSPAQGVVVEEMAPAPQTSQNPQILEGQPPAAPAPAAAAPPGPGGGR
jgi:Tfp pilus assembly protein PilN